MRYKEIVSLPSTPEEAQNAILDLVTVYKGKKASSIPMDEILGVLHNQGYDADKRWVMDTLRDKAGIQRIAKDEVILQPEEPPETASDEEAVFSQDKVAQMATSAAKKSIKNG